MAAGSRDPDLAPFVGTAHIGNSLLVAPSAGGARLGYLTEMERDEAASTGIELLQPELLDAERLRRQGVSPAEFWAAVIGAGLDLSGVATGRVGLAGRFPAGTVHAACARLEKAGWKFEPGHELLLELRKVKTPVEVTEIRRSALAVVEAFTGVAELLATAEPGGDGLGLDGSPLTARRLRGRISRIFATHGVEQPEGNIVAAGAAAGVPHSQGDSQRVLQAGEAIVVDLFPKGHLYADCTRTFCVGTPPPELARAHEAVLETLVEAHDGARAGAVAADLQRVACDRLAGAGYATAISDPGTRRGYVHGLGHGVGFDLHEYPSFRPEPHSGGELAVGDVFTLEPGLYDPEAGWGVRLEDLCHLTPEGLEILTPLPYELDPRAWS